MHNNTVYEWILHSTFTISARIESLQSAKPHLSPIVYPGDKTLDLCCGSGFISFWLEGQGAKVRGIDFALYMISLAQEEANQRSSIVEFIEADIFALDFEQDRFDLVTCFDSISDFPVSDFAKLGKKIASALKPGGRFVVKYVDGSYKLYQEEPERIIFRFKEYLPEVGAIVNIIRNETRGEEYERKGYIYTVPVVRLALGSDFQLERHIVLDENQYLDIFIKPQRP